MRFLTLILSCLTLLSQAEEKPNIILIYADDLGAKYVVDKKEKFLFNLKEDRGERHNLASSYPEKLKEVEALFKKEKGSSRRDL